MSLFEIYWGKLRKLTESMKPGGRGGDYWLPPPPSTRRLLLSLDYYFFSFITKQEISPIRMMQPVLSTLPVSYQVGQTRDGLKGSACFSQFAH